MRLALIVNISHRADRRAVGRLRWRRGIQPLRVFLKLLNLPCGKEGLRLFGITPISLKTVQPLLKLMQSRCGNRSHLSAGPFVCR